MKYTPRPYAPEAVQFLIETGRCNIWMDPGMGKTSIVLSALDLLQLMGSNKFPALVIAPLRVARGVWTDEVDKWDHLHDLRIAAMVGSSKQRYEQFQQDAHIYTINYENIEWLVNGCDGNWPFKTVIADESTKLKGFRQIHGAKRAAALAKAASMTARWANLSGTPSPNGLTDLWGPQWFVDGGRSLGASYTDFIQRWFDEDRLANRVTPKSFAQEQILDALAPTTLNLAAGDFMDLEEIIFNPVYVDLNRRVRSLYDEFERDMVVSIGDGTLTAKMQADLTLKCLQLASGATYNEDRSAWNWIHDEKIDALADLVEELGGNPLLTVYHFRHDLERILKKFPQARLLKTKKDEDDWNAGKIPVGLVHPASAGHGLNLQHGGHHLCFFSHWWDLEHYLQVIDRIGPVRQLQSGYNRSVFVHKIMARNTVDELVDRRRRTKESVQQAVRNGVQDRRQLL